MPSLSGKRVNIGAHAEPTMPAGVGPGPAMEYACIRWPLIRQRETVKAH
jgi:hypothetical protein